MDARESQVSKTPVQMVLLWFAPLFFFVLAILSGIFLFEYQWVTAGLAVLGVASLIAIAVKNRKSLATRSGHLGIYSAVSVIIALIGVVIINYFGFKNPKNWDWTQGQKYTLSNETLKVLQTLEREVKALYFTKMPVPDKDNMILDLYKGVNPKFKIELVDVDREVSRARAAGIRQTTLQISVGDKTENITNLTEEGITNALIKVLKTKESVLCSITGHGEKNFDSREADGYFAVKRVFEAKTNKVKTIKLSEEAKIPADCDAVAILGPSSKYFEHEIKILEDYLANGGRALIALDLDLKKGQDPAPEFGKLLAKWHVKPQNGLLIDGKMLAMSAQVRLLGLRVDPTQIPVNQLSKEHSITKEFPLGQQVHFPMTRSFEIVSKDKPAGLNTSWLAKAPGTTWAESDLSSLVRGRPSYDKNSDKKGELHTAVAVEGKLKDSKAKENTRIVVLGSSFLAANQFVRAGGNVDLFMNSMNWLVANENLISVAKKGDDKVELTLDQKELIFWITVVFVPLFTAVGGIVVWARRRRL